MENLKDIIEALKIIRKETKTKVSDEILWDTAVRIFNSREIKEKKEKEPATEKQKCLLKKLNQKYKTNITKEEARDMIERILKESKNKSTGKWV